jgi:dihydrodipicolinate synthase/N-acetylneuraminate lyase
LDERRQRALSRYYLAAGVGGLAVGVHTTQFAIRDPHINLLRPVLELARNAVDEYLAARDDPSLARVLVAGICGATTQAAAEARTAADLGYHAGLLSLGGLSTDSDDGLLTHARQVAEEIPLIGFYLQPSVGGRSLSFNFWRQFCEIPNVIAIKVAPFNRYQTLDVVRAVAMSGRSEDIALYTGNDDNIVMDLLSEYRVATPDAMLSLQFTGGLLGHWACWTRAAVELYARIGAAKAHGELSEWLELQALAHQVTDMNAAIFDVAHGFRGCIAGIHEVLRRQGLLAGIRCLDPNETLSPGQAAEISRVSASYPHLVDDDFVRENLDRWLA